MNKQIVYFATDNGVDGRAPTSVMYASFSEKERDAMIDADASKAWRGKGEKIIDEKTAQAQALAKLDGIDRLVLGLSPWPARFTDGHSEHKAEAKMAKSEPITSSLEFNQSDLDRNRRLGRVTRSGVIYDTDLAAVPGVTSFVLLREPHTTDDMLKAAVQQLRLLHRDRRVVGSIKVAAVLPAQSQHDRPRGG